MSAEWFALWWPAFLSTILAETPIVALFLRDRIGLGRALLLGVALQCLTHPLFWIAWEAESRLFFDHYTASVIGFEAIIYMIEAAVIWAFIRRTTGRFGALSVAFAASTTANTVSLLLGFLSAR